MLRHGWGAKARHRLLGGRTGSVHIKRRKKRTKANAYVSVDPTRTARKRMDEPLRCFVYPKRGGFVAECIDGPLAPIDYVWSSATTIGEAVRACVARIRS